MHAIWDALRRLITPPLDGEDEPSPPRAHAVRALEPHNPPAGASRPHKRRHTVARDEPSSREFRRPVDLDERLPVLLVSDDADAPCAPTPCASPLAARPPPRLTCAPPPSLIPITPPAAHIDLPRWRALPPPPAHAAARAFSRPDAYIVRSRSTRAPAELAAADSEASAAAPRARPGAGWAELMDALETSLDQPAHRSAAAKEHVRSKREWPACPRLSPVMQREPRREALGAARARRSAGKRPAPPAGREGKAVLTTTRRLRLRAAG